MTTTTMTEDRVWQTLAGVPDPELPMVSVTELGIVREVRIEDGGVTVVVTPTYSGCPATEMIAQSIRDALEQAGAGEVHMETRLSPPWTTDWLTPEAAAKLRAGGIAAPGPRGQTAQTLHFLPPCPRCGEKHTTRLSEFGSTACKAMYRCPSCLEPFEYFKPF